MNRILQDLRYAVRGTFDLYIHHGKRLFSSSATVLVVSVLTGLAVSIAVILAGAFAKGIQDEVLGGAEDNILSLVLVSQLGSLLQAILILVAGAYGIALHRVPEGESSAPGQLKTGVDWVINRLKNQEKTFFVGCLIVLLIIHVLLLINPFATNSPGGFLGAFDGISHQYSYRGIAFDLVEFVKNIVLPVFLAMLVVQRSIWGRFEPDILRTYRSAYWSSALLLFGLDSVFSSIVWYLCYTVVPAIIIPFISPEDPSSPDTVVTFTMITGIARSLVSLGVTVFLFPAFASALVLPFYSEEERLASQEDVDVGPDDAETIE